VTALMTPGEFDSAVTRLSFWPGWRFVPYLDRHLGLMVHIIGTVPDREDPAVTTDLGIRVRPCPCALRGPRHLAEWLLWRMEEAFVHEAREGLRLDGRLVSDPHAGGA
jgi:hypothetical protein